MANTEAEIDTGDVVLHGPSNERWVVACVQGDYLSWCGWPEGQAKLSDCTLVSKSSLEEREKLLCQLAQIYGDDHRKNYARLRLNAPAPFPEMNPKQP